MGENQVDDSLLSVAEDKTDGSVETTAVDDNLDVDVSGVKNVNIDELVAEESSESEKATVDFNESVETCELEKDSQKIIIHSNVRLDVLNNTKSHANDDKSTEKSSHKKKKRLKIFDSDSEEENVLPETTGDKSPTSGDGIEKENQKPVSSNVFCVVITVLMFCFCILPETFVVI